MLLNFFKRLILFAICLVHSLLLKLLNLRLAVFVRAAIVLACGPEVTSRAELVFSFDFWVLNLVEQIAAVACKEIEFFSANVTPAIALLLFQSCSVASAIPP